MNLLFFGGTSGIGNEILKKIKRSKENIKLYATYNKTNKKIKGISYLKLDLNKDHLFKKKLEKYENLKFDYVLFAAAVTDLSPLVDNEKCTVGDLELKYFTLLMKTNCYSNLKLFEILHKKNMIKEKSKIIFFSSKAGSIELRGKLKHNKPFGNIFYRISKAALNCAIKNLSYDFKKKYEIITLHPGFVRTKNVGRSADLSPSYSAQKIINSIIFNESNNNGKFLDLYGKLIKW
jgi:NAD(P)-dependent dehydrogenase (short-subunit alcohol dehydrogenase family)